MQKERKVSNSTYKKVIKQWVDEMDDKEKLKKIYNFIFHIIIGKSDYGE